MAGLANAAGVFDPAGRPGLGCRCPRAAGAIGRAQRVGSEQRQDVGQQQFLVLLLVIDADLHEPGNFGLRLDAFGKQLHQRFVHVRPIGQDTLAGRAA